jgi:hypothetical protein
MCNRFQNQDPLILVAIVLNLVATVLNLVATVLNLVATVLNLVATVLNLVATVLNLVATVAWHQALYTPSLTVLILSQINAISFSYYGAKQASKNWVPELMYSKISCVAVERL